MPNTRNPRARQAKSITGRDGLIELLALAFAIAALERSEKDQEWSKDMRLLLDHFCPSKVAPAATPRWSQGSPHRNRLGTD